MDEKYWGEFREAGERSLNRSTLNAWEAATLDFMLEGATEQASPSVDACRDILETRREALRFRPGATASAVACAPTHIWLCHLLGLRTETSLVTIGDVIVNGTPLFGTTLQYLDEELRNPSDGEFRAHVWLTLPNRGVWDATLAFRLAPPHKRDVRGSGLLDVPFVPAARTHKARGPAGHNVRAVSGKQYRVRWAPLLVGEEALYRMRVLQQELEPVYPRPAHLRDVR